MINLKSNSICLQIVRITVGLSLRTQISLPATVALGFDPAEERRGFSSKHRADDDMNFTGKAMRRFWSNGVSVGGGERK